MFSKNFSFRKIFLSILFLVLGAGCGLNGPSNANRGNPALIAQPPPETQKIPEKMVSNMTLLVGFDNFGSTDKPKFSSTR